MAPELADLIAALTCGVCNGNGWLGGRSLKKIGEFHHYQQEGRKCEGCGGTGVHGDNEKD